MFANREDAARQLAKRLKPLNLKNPLVLGIPRGGVVTASLIAHELEADLDVVLARKLRAPWQPEFALGGISEDGNVFLNPDIPAERRIPREYLKEECCTQMAEMRRRRKLFRGENPPTPVTGRSVIVTDDGIATGSTMIAALQCLRLQHPHELIAAVPVAPSSRLDEIKRWCDQAICLNAPQDFRSVGEFYEDFRQVEDEEVVELLKDGATSFA